MNLQQIEDAIASQRATVARIRSELERTDERDVQAARSLRADLGQAQQILLRLDQLHRQETPLDARPGRGSSVFFGSNS
jgi:hypothetical protein